MGSRSIALTRNQLYDGRRRQHFLCADCNWLVGRAIVVCVLSATSLLLSVSAALPHWLATVCMCIVIYYAYAQHMDRDVYNVLKTNCACV